MPCWVGLTVMDLLQQQKSSALKLIWSPRTQNKRLFLQLRHQWDIDHNRGDGESQSPHNWRWKKKNQTCCTRESSLMLFFFFKSWCFSEPLIKKRNCFLNFWNSNFFSSHDYYTSLVSFAVCRSSLFLFLKTSRGLIACKNSASNEVVGLHLMHFFFQYPPASAIN